MTIPSGVEPVFEKTRTTFVALLASVFYLLASVSTYAATECSTADGFPNITLQTQDDVDNFQSVYGPCDTITRSLVLLHGPFANLDGLGDIVSITADLQLIEMAVPAASAFPNLNNISGTLRIESTFNGSNPSLSAFPSLTTLGGLYIDLSMHITSLSGMTNLVDLGSIWLSSVQLLTSLTGLPAGLDMIKELRFSGNESLQSLEGLSPVKGVRTLGIEDNSVLTSISALDGSTFDDSYGFPPDNPPGAPSLSLEKNPLLANLKGVPSVPTVSVESINTAVLGGLWIARNPLVTSLDVLDGLVEVWGNVGIFENGALSDCSVLSTVVDAVDDGFVGPNQNASDPSVFPPDLVAQFGGIYMGDNVAGCNSIAEILAAANEDGVFMDSFETKITE